MRIRKFTVYKKCVAAIIIALLCCANTRAQTGIDTSLANTLQNSINSLRTMYNVKGISAAAYIPGKGIWKGVTGVSYGTEAIDTSMIFDVGSIAKTFAAADIFKLVEAGQLSLSDTVGALLPPLPNVNTGITVAQLLSHTSGMADYLTPDWSSAMLADPTAIWYYPVAFQTFCPTPVGGPASPFQYCNSNYALLGMIIEAKTGDSLHRVMRNDFVNPLNLTNTYLEVYETYPNVIPHNWSTPTLNPSLATDVSSIPREALWSSTEGPGGFLSDPAGIVKWGYNLYSGNVIAPSSLTQMLSFAPVAGGYFNGYGLGAMRFVANGRSYYGHAGNFFGFAASMLYYPQDSICVAVLINQDCIATYEAQALMNTLIKKLATGIRTEELNDKVAIVPNPANTEFTISIPGATSNSIQITVVDAVGRINYQSDMHVRSLSINTTNFQAGEYFVKINSNGETVTRHITIQH